MSASKAKAEEETSGKKDKAEETGEAPVKEVYLIRCPKCGKSVDRARVVKRKYVCYECGGYFKVKIHNRIRMVADLHTFEPWFTDMPVKNPLAYEGYEEKLAEAREKTGLDEAVTVGRCKVFGEDIVLGICDSRFLMASMGQTVGEKSPLPLNAPLRKGCPCLCSAAPGAPGCRRELFL